MKMVIMSPPGANALQPGALGSGLAAQRALDGGVDEDTFDLGPAREGFEQAAVLRPPHRRVDVSAIRRHDIGRRYVVALHRAETALRHRGEPDIGIELDLMRGVPGQHRLAAPLPDIPDQEARPAGGRRKFGGTPLLKADARRMASSPAARRPHYV